MFAGSFRNSKCRFRWARQPFCERCIISSGPGQAPAGSFLVFIDRKGVIRAQYTGVDEAFFDDHQEQHMRDEAEKLLNEGAGKSKPGHKTHS